MADPSPPIQYPGSEYPEILPNYGGGLRIDPYVFALMLKVGIDSSTDPYSLDYQVQHGGGGGGVESFNTRTGFVTLESSDIEATFGAKGQLYVGTGSGSGALLNSGTVGQVPTVQLDGSLAYQTPSAGGVTSFNTRTGAVVAATGDYTVAQVTGAAPLSSPALTGTPTAPTATPLTDNTQLATTAYADLAVGVETTRAETAEALLAPRASPAFTGTPTAPTASPLTDNTQVATTAYADLAVGVETTRAEAAEALALLKANNLSDVPTKGTGRFNLRIPILASAQCAATANVNIASAPASVDGFAFVSSGLDSVLLTGQSTPSQNGTWVWNGAGSALTRTADMPSGGVLTTGRTINIQNGTVNAGTVWSLPVPSAGLTIDTSAQTWKQVPYLSAGAVVPGTILATQVYAPATLATYALSTSMAAVDTTNLTLSFTVPASGIVDIEVNLICQVNAGAGLSNVLGCSLRQHGTSTTVGIWERVLASIASTLGSALDSAGANSVKFHLTGLTPGALQLDYAAQYLSGSGNSATIYAQGATSGTAPIGPFIMQAKASI